MICQKLLVRLKVSYPIKMRNNKKRYTWLAQQPVQRESVDLEPVKRLSRSKSIYMLEEEQGKLSAPKKPRVFGSTLEVPKKDLPASLEETDRDSVMPEQFRVPPNLAQLLLSESVDTDNDEFTPLYDRLTLDTLQDHEAPKEEFNWEEEAARDSVSSTRPPKEKYLRHSKESMREYSEMKLTIDWNTDENTGPTGLSFEPLSVNGSKAYGSGRESIDSKKCEWRNSKGERISNETLPPATSERKLKSVTPDRNTQSSQMRSNQHSRKNYEDDSFDKGRSSAGSVRYDPESYYEPNETDRAKKSCGRRMNEPSEIASSLIPETSDLPEVPPIMIIPPDSSVNSVPCEIQEKQTSPSEGSGIAPGTFAPHKCAQRKIYQEKSREKFLNEKKKRDSCMSRKETYSPSSTRMTETFLEDYSPYKPEQIEEVSASPDKIRSPVTATSDSEPGTSSSYPKKSKGGLQELYFDSKDFETHQTSVVDPNFLARVWDTTTKTPENIKMWSRPEGKLPIPTLVSNQNFEAKAQIQSSVYRDLYEDKYLNTQRDSAYKPPKKYYKTFFKRKMNRGKSMRNPTIQYPPIQSKSNLKLQMDTMNDSLEQSRFSHFRHTFSSTISNSPRQTVTSVGGQNRQESRDEKGSSLHQGREHEKGSSLHQEDEWQWPKEGTGNRKCRAFKNRKQKYE